MNNTMVTICGVDKEMKRLLYWYKSGYMNGITIPDSRDINELIRMFGVCRDDRTNDNVISLVLLENIIIG